MYVRCTVNLCITTMPSAKCPDLCTTRLTRSAMVNNVFSSSYTITSPAVSLVHTPAPPTTLSTAPVTTTTTTPTTTPTTTTTTTTTAPATTTTTTTTTAAPTTSHAPEKAPSLAVGAIVAFVCVILKPFL
ncbi:integumentary mucin C.1-like [Boleophthalmus pectinirostris]|uniref:integumentary mucin C.1-like n=1 Tax=Boleophthalmus pectinirostris TaxID=150288 RepID=UPI00242E4D4F|nr:integumentary mucin C.1-like [Boleophthalmus pectinirostris]